MRTIQETLSQLTPAPYEIRTSIVHQSVYVEHDPELTATDIRDALEAAGFDIVSTPVLEQYILRRTNTSISSLHRVLARRQAKHTENCLQCRNDTEQSVFTAVESFGSQVGEKLVDAVNRHRALSPISSLNLDVSSTDVQKAPPPAPAPVDEGPYNVAFSVGGMTCASCVGNVTNTMTGISGVTNVAVNLIAKSATATVSKKDLVGQITEAVSDSGYECEAVSIEPVQVRVPKIKVPVAKHEKTLYRASFSVGGMTCAACVGNVTQAVKDIPGVSEVAVNLVGKSATAVLQDKSLAKPFVEAVEDGGYEAELITIEPLNEKGGATDSSGPRTVALKVEGMFCK